MIKAKLGNMCRKELWRRWNDKESGMKCLGEKHLSLKSSSNAPSLFTPTSPLFANTGNASFNSSVNSCRWPTSLREALCLAPCPCARIYRMEILILAQPSPRRSSPMCSSGASGESWMSRAKTPTRRTLSVLSRYVYYM